MAISAQDVKKLREMTGAGMMDCKKALTETEGDFDAAVEFLRKKGLATAAKKAGRIAAEGIVLTTIKDDKKAAIVEVNSETDFVAKNDVFKGYVNELLEVIVSNDVADVEALKAAKWVDDSAATVDEKHTAMVAKIGEKLDIRRFEKITTDGIVVSYIHAGGKIGVLVEAESSSSSDAVKTCLENVAMQVAAMNPQFLNREAMSQDVLAKEKEIIIDSALADPASLPKPILNAVITEAIESKKWSDEDIAIYEEKKSNMQYLFNFLSKEAAQTLRDIAATHKAEYLENKIFAGLVEGRFSKHLKEICLVDQEYFQAENKENVGAYVANVAKAEGVDLKLKKFIRFETGEGLEKKNEDFAAEVAAQMNA